MRKVLRTVFAVALWIPVTIIDRLRGLDPPARLKWALDWARKTDKPLIRVRRSSGPRYFCATCCVSEGEQHLEWCHRPGVMNRD